MAKRTLRFKDCVETYRKIHSEVESRHFKPIYLLMGDESYFIDMLSDALVQRVLSDEHRAFNQIILYGRDSDAGQVTTISRQVPMTSEPMLVIVREAQQLRSIEKLAHYASNPSPSTVLVLCHKEKSMDKRSALYKSIERSGVVFESVRPRDYEIGTWLSSFVTQKGCKISPKALSMLVENLGTDISKISNELSKLLLTMPEGVTSIEDSHIEQNVGISKDFNNFELCAAVLSRNLSRALFIAEHFAHNPKAHPLLLTIMALFAQFKQLFTLNYLGWLSRQKGERFPSDTELMRIVKVGNPYAISELKQHSTKWPNAKVFAALGLLREYDSKSKGIGSGGASDGELLRELLLKIASL